MKRVKGLAAAIAGIVLAGIGTGAMAVDVDLYVTDFGQNPTADQRPAADEPVAYGDAKQVTIERADGSKVTVESPTLVTISKKGQGNARQAKIFASPGEYEPFSFLLRPKEAMEQVTIVAGDLAGTAGRIPASAVRIASVEGFHGAGRSILMPVGGAWNMQGWSTEHFVCTVKVPADAKAGAYEGTVTVKSKGEAVGEIAVALEVLPIKLEDVPFSLGLNYSSPKDPRALAAHLADMREHGMTCVAPLYKFHLPVHDSDTSEFGAFIEAYKKAGFAPPLYFATPMDLQLTELAGYGNETSKRWQQKYIKVMQLLHAEAQKHEFPVLFSIGDELTNKGVEGVKIAGRLARFVNEELPEIATTSDMNGYMEVMAMAPYLNVATFNNGWDGIDHHNKGRTLINRGFIEEVRKTGAIPWFVNAGTDRFPFGFFFWKMSKLGVKGKVEWYYNLDNERGSLVRTEGEKVYPTLDYERAREGIDDLKYICKLERSIAEAKRSGKAAAEREAAEKLLSKIEGSIAEDWNAYERGGAKFPADGFAVMDPQKAAGLGKLNAVRRAIADEIVKLEAAMK